MPTYVDLHFFRVKSIDILWNNVTRMETRYLEIQDCYEVLRLATKLSRCFFGVARPFGNQLSESDWIGGQNIVHQNLQEVSINFVSTPTEVPLFCEKVTLPCLESLTIDTGQTYLSAANLLSLLGRSAGVLEKLTLVADFTEEELLTLLRAVPRLWRLQITCGNSTLEGFFKLLARTSHAVVVDANDPNASDRAEEIFLPDLRLLLYITSQTEECERLWDLIPDALGIPGTSSRPLAILEVAFNPHLTGGGGYHYREPSFISKETLQWFRNLAYHGAYTVIELLLGPDECEDFIDASWTHNESEGDCDYDEDDEECGSGGDTDDDGNEI